jgi:hypothetical protein
VTNIFFIESPLQLLCAIEAKKYFISSKNKLYVLYHHNKNTRNQINKLLSIFLWDDVYFFKKRISSKIEYLDAILLLRNLRKENIGNIFIGTITSYEVLMLLSNIKHKNSYLLDDGVATINIQKAICSNQFLDLIHKEKQKKISRYLNKAFMLKPFKHNSIDLFTFFEIQPRENQKIIRNAFPHLRSLTTTNCPIVSEKIYFLGSKLVESDRMTHKNYIHLLRKIKSYYQGKKIVYVPHRGEDQQNISSISEKLHFEIDYFTYPCEIEFLQRNILPKNISSFFSTALYTLREIYPTACVECFYIDGKLITQYRRNEIKNIYTYYEKYFRIIQL